MKICLIPARSGSKRIKNKNIKLFFGKPMIAFAIKNAKKTKLFDKIIVSTDSKKIAKISSRYGAEIPFLRPKKLADDKTVDKTVINHFLKNFKQRIEYLCYLYPNSPLLKTSTLIKGFKQISKKNHQQLITICKNKSDTNKVFKLGKNNVVKILKKGKKHDKKSNFFYDAGQCYWFNLKKNVKKKILGFPISKYEGVDINNYEDLKLVKILYSKKYLRI